MRDEGQVQAWCVLQENISYTFKDLALLEQALTHASKSGRGHITNERLEFLGDRVLGHSVAYLLFTAFPDLSEGPLAKMEAFLVSAPTLAGIAEKWGVGPALILSASEERAGGRGRQNILADAAEALIAAIALDGGFDAVQKVVQHVFEPLLESCGQGTIYDPKSYIQEWAQARQKPLPTYEVIRQEGPGHAPQFTVHLMIEGYAPVAGVGPSKRLAEISAAQIFIQNVEGGAICPKK